MRHTFLAFALAAVPLSCVEAGPLPGAPACELLPSNNVWRADVRGLPVHPRSPSWLAAMNAGTRRLHPDFGPSDGPQPYGIPFEVVPGDHPKVAVAFEYEEESDPGPYPFDAGTPIEGGSDRHALMLDRDACVLYELFAADHNDGAPTAGSGAVWDLQSNTLRPRGWTSADAAGLPILPGLVRRDEVLAGRIDHAIRVTASRTDRSYVWPARHQAGHASDPALPPMGARFRLKATFDLSGFHPEAQVILRAMREHGLILADNGSDWYFGGASEHGWTDEVLDDLKSVPASAFEAVDASPLMVDPDSGEARVRPAATVRARFRPRAVDAGGVARLRGGVTPAHPGGRVQLQRRRQGSWVTVRTSRIDAAGRFTFRIRAVRPGRVRYRARYPGGAVALPAASPSRVLMVRSA